MGPHRLHLVLVLAFGSTGAWALACSSSNPSSAVLSASDAAAGSLADSAALGSPADAATDGGGADAAPCLGDDLALLDGGGPGSLVVNGAIDCTNVPAACQASCARIVHNYRAGVALEATACMREGCLDSDDVVPCVDRALAHACSSPTAPAFCTPLTSACLDTFGDASPAQSTFPENGCEVFAGAFTDAGRAELAACIESVTPNGGCPRGAADCADRIRQ